MNYRREENLKSAIFFSFLLHGVIFFFAFFSYVFRSSDRMNAPMSVEIAGESELGGLFNSSTRSANSEPKPQPTVSKPVPQEKEPEPKIDEDNDPNPTQAEIVQPMPRPEPQPLPKEEIPVEEKPEVTPPEPEPTPEPEPAPAPTPAPDPEPVENSEPQIPADTRSEESEDEILNRIGQEIKADQNPTVDIPEPEPQDQSPSLEEIEAQEEAERKREEEEKAKKEAEEREREEEFRRIEEEEKHRKEEKRKKELEEQKKKKEKKRKKLMSVLNKVEKQDQKEKKRKKIFEIAKNSEQADKKKKSDAAFDKLLDESISSLSSRKRTSSKTSTASGNSSNFGTGSGGGRVGLSKGDLDMIKSQICPHWIVPSGIRNAEDIVVEIRVQINSDGSVIPSSIKILNEERYNSDDAFRVSADSARRAILEASPLKIPREKIDLFGDCILRFNLKEALRE